MSITDEEYNRMKPHVRRTSVTEEVMQITLAPGEWIQVVLNIGGSVEPEYEIVQLAVTAEGKVEVRGNVGMRPWFHEAQPLEASE